MKKLIIISLIALFFSFDLKAQGTNPAFINLHEFYTYGNYGSARSQAMGGAFTALGGDMSSTYINPAGLGFYNRSEYGLNINGFSGPNTTHYIGNKGVNHPDFQGDIGQLGVVFNFNNTGTRLKSSSLGITYGAQSNYISSFSYEGNNASSSIADGFAELANAAGKSPEAIELDYEKYGYAQRSYEMAYMAYLTDYFGDHYEAMELNLPVVQQGKLNKTGYLGQFNIGYGVNFDDKTYIGANLGVQTLHYTSETIYDEIFPQPEYNSRLYYENFLVIDGTGVNMTVGAIHRLGNSLNIGASITTPTLTKFTDRFEEYAGSKGVSEDGWDEARTGSDEIKYRVTSPLKASLGLAAFLPNRIGVVSGEAELIGYQGMTLKDKTSNSAIGDQTIMIKDEYRNVVNLKAGVELRKGIVRLRGGVNWINSPMAEPAKYNLKSDYLVSSAGIGVRTSSFYADFSFSTSTQTGAYNPYVLTNGDHYSVETHKRNNTFGLTLGSFF